jgi:hypothetical protein
MELLRKQRCCCPTAKISWAALSTDPSKPGLTTRLLGQLLADNSSVLGGRGKDRSYSMDAGFHGKILHERRIGPAQWMQAFMEKSCQSRVTNCSFPIPQNKLSMETCSTQRVTRISQLASYPCLKTHANNDEDITFGRSSLLNKHTQTMTRMTHLAAYPCLINTRKQWRGWHIWPLILALII